jgi:CCR4-NOT transcription complex subunit 7/8
MSDQTDTDDKLMDTTVSVSECTKTNVLQLNSSLNIISRKPSGNTVFIVPQQNTSTDDTESLSQLMSTFSPPSSALVDDKKIANNKLTLIPLNLNSQPSHSSIKLSGSTTPVKSLNEPSMKAIISPVISSKKVIISTPSSGLNQAIKTTSVNLSASNSGLNDKPIVTPLNNRLSSATNTKIFTISTQNNLKTLTQQSSTTNSSNSLPQQNISTINATSITNNPNKIQYVKIVNTANNTQHIQMHQQTIPKTVTTTKPALLATNNKAIKITTISANTNNNSIITTTTNNSNDNNNNNNDNISLNNNSNSNNNISTHSMLNNLVQSFFIVL